MTALLRFIPIAIMLVGAVILFQRPAYAYADPGTGLLAIQALGSSIIAVGWYLRRRIYTLFRRGAEPKHEGHDFQESEEKESNPR
jgi:hypothetical protein